MEMEIEKSFNDTSMYQDLVAIANYLDTFGLGKSCILEKYKTACPFWKFDEKTFWQFEEVLNYEADRIRLLNGGVKTRRAVNLDYAIYTFDSIIELLLEATTDTKAKSRDSRCVVCYENEICVTVGPCGHFIICHYCSNRLTSCPVCRAPRN
jgi:hypothetical protein